MSRLLYPSHPIPSPSPSSALPLHLPICPSRRTDEGNGYRYRYSKSPHHTIPSGAVSMNIPGGEEKPHVERNGASIYLSIDRSPDSPMCNSHIHLLAMVRNIYPYGKERRERERERETVLRPIFHFQFPHKRRQPGVAMPIPNAAVLFCCCCGSRSSSATTLFNEGAMDTGMFESR